MYWNLHLRERLVFVPTTGKLDSPVYREMEPVDVVPIADADGIRRAIHSTIARGNPPAPTYSSGNFPPPVLLKYAGVKSWSAFERGALTWGIEQTDGIYRIIGYRRNAKGYSEPDPDQKIKFPTGTNVNAVVERMIAILQDSGGGQQRT